MELVVTRNWKKQDYTIGRLYVNGEYLCNTLEDRVRDLSREKKVAGKTAIPAGRYSITMNVISPKYSKKAAYKWCDGRLPRLLNVPQFEGILIHAGNTAKDTEGCILVGKNTVKGGLTESQKCLKQLWELLDVAYRRGEEIVIVVENGEVWQQ